MPESWRDGVITHSSGLPRKDGMVITPSAFFLSPSRYGSRMRYNVESVRV